MDDEGRAAKLRRLDSSRRRLPYISAQALAAVYKDVLEHGVPDIRSRRFMIEAKKLLKETQTPFGKLQQQLLLPKQNGQVYRLNVIHPLAMLWHCWETCDGWSDLLAEKHMQNPSSIDSPWSLILYTDEVTPGDVNATAPTRKVQTIYWSFKELGHAILCKEDAWFCALVLRSSTCRSFVAGGLAQTMGALLKTFFPAVGTNLQHTGMFLSKNGTEFRLFAKLAIVVQDGAAHKEFWSCRDGTRLCMKCLTVEASSELSGR